MKRVALLAIVLGCCASAGLAQRGGSHGGGFSGHGGSSFHGGGFGHGGFGGVGGPRGAAPSRFGGSRPTGFPRAFNSGPRGFRAPYNNPAHRMPYHSPYNHGRDRDRDRDRGRFFGWGGYPWWNGWGPWIPNYPLFWGDDYGWDDSDQQNNYADAQPYPDSGYGYGGDSGDPNQGAPYPAPYGPGYAPGYPAPYGNPYGAAMPPQYQGNYGSAEPTPYRPPAQVPQSARAPYHPADGVSAPAPDSPVTIVFKDGRPPEKIHNYLLTARTLSVLDSNHQEIPIDQLDLAATARVNRQAGIDFEVPGTDHP